MSAKSRSSDVVSSDDEEVSEDSSLPSCDDEKLRGYELFFAFLSSDWVSAFAAFNSAAVGRDFLVRGDDLRSAELPPGERLLILCARAGVPASIPLAPAPVCDLPLPLPIPVSRPASDGAVSRKDRLPPTRSRVGVLRLEGCSCLLSAFPQSEP